MIENDHSSPINDLAQDVDQVSPFIYPSKVGKINIEQDAVVYRVQATCEGLEDPTAARVLLSLLDSGNSFFAEY